MYSESRNSSRCRNLAHKQFLEQTIHNTIQYNTHQTPRNKKNMLGCPYPGEPRQRLCPLKCHRNPAFARLSEIQRLHDESGSDSVHPAVMEEIRIIQRRIHEDQTRLANVENSQQESTLTDEQRSRIAMRREECLQRRAARVNQQQEVGFVNMDSSSQAAPLAQTQVRRKYKTKQNKTTLHEKHAVVTTIRYQLRMRFSHWPLLLDKNQGRRRFNNCQLPDKRVVAVKNMRDTHDCSHCSMIAGTSD